MIFQVITENGLSSTFPIEIEEIFRLWAIQMMKYNMLQKSI